MMGEYIGDKTDFYVAETDVAKTVNLAIKLKRPILVEGEPGCGKTMLAYSIAAELGYDPPTKFVVRSTAKAQDLLYRVDMLRRLQDAQRKDNEESRFMYPYLSLGELGRAIYQPALDGKRRVVLIDEVDKADIDFPNDLLGVLEKFEFSISPLNTPDEAEGAQKLHGFGSTIKAAPNLEPIIVITSNREKRLPEPFLRRCLYVHIPFPSDDKRLIDIVTKNLKKDDPQTVNKTVITRAVASFQDLRENAIKLGVQKAPSTSELIDWVRILYYDTQFATPEERTEAIEAKGMFPPNWELLFKTMNDRDLYKSLDENDV